MISKRFFELSLLVTLLISSAQSDICTEELSYMTQYEISVDNVVCKEKLCQNLQSKKWYIYPYLPSQFSFPIFDMELKYIIQCGIETNVSLPIVFPVPEQYAEGIKLSLEIKRIAENYLPEKTFAEFKYVTELHLNNLGIKHISTEAFQDLEDCEEIHLSGNTISEIPAGVFSGLKKLTILDLSNNWIEELNRITSGIPKENSLFLNLSHNRIDLVEKTHFQTLFQNISSLDLSFNEIADINFDYVDDSISSMDISHNHLSEITGCIYKIPQLLLSHNNIKSIEIMCLNENLVMQYLDISHNQISTLNFQTFPEKFGIHVLLMQFNMISNFTVGTFSNLMQLEILNLSYNRIDSLPKSSFEGLENLKELDLSNNYLKKLDFSILRSFQKLKRLYIQNNMIKEIDYKNLLSRFPKIKLINLDNNIFICDSLMDMVFYLEENDVDIVYGSTKYTQNIRGVACYNRLNHKSNKEDRNDSTGKTDKVEFMVETVSYYQQIRLFWMTIVTLTLLLLLLSFQTYMLYCKYELKHSEDVEMM